MSDKKPKTKILDDYFRHDLVELLQGDRNIGVELGIAEGVFSERAWNSGKFRQYFGVDMYADGHDTDQYKRALKRLGIMNPGYRLLRMRFDQAVDLFEDRSLDFIYVDGYAHSGEEGGSTFVDWYRKLKIGGVFAGDDYDNAWPQVTASVDYFVSQVDETLLVTGKTEAEEFCKYPSWAIVKSKDVDVVASPELVEKGKADNRKQTRDHLRREMLTQLAPDWAKRLRRAVIG